MNLNDFEEFAKLGIIEVTLSREAFTKFSESFFPQERSVKVEGVIYKGNTNPVVNKVYTDSGVVRVTVGN